MRTDNVQTFDLHNIYQATVTGACTLGAGFLAMAADAGPLGQALVSVTGGLMAIIYLLVKHWLIDRPKKSEVKELNALREENKEQSTTIASQGNTIASQGKQIDDLSTELTRLKREMGRLKKKAE